MVGPDWRGKIFQWLLNGRLFWFFLAWDFDLRSGFFLRGDLFGYLLMDVLTIFSFIFSPFGLRVAGLRFVSTWNVSFLDWLVFVDLLHFLELAPHC